GMVANRDRIIGDEWGMGFGQVASLVAFTTVLYAVFLSWQGLYGLDQVPYPLAFIHVREQSRGLPYSLYHLIVQNHN
ncbi:13817_t:CDS:2, partial [Acaulospora colombiana]